MSDRTEGIELRGKVALAFAVLSIAVPLLLNMAGVTNYNSEVGPRVDKGIWERVCLVSESMLPGCFIAWAAAAFRVKNASLFAENHNTGRIFPVVCGVAGAVWLGSAFMNWGPFTGAEFGTFADWRFVLGWIPVWWCLVFVRFL
jgi:hypothetical protein